MEAAYKTVCQLVTDFKENEKAYLSSSYQESQVRQDFIDKFFTALGWDVTHTRQKNPYEQEVKIENRVATKHSVKRADYAFHVAPNFRDVKFFVEAKKPCQDLLKGEYYHQTVRYGWNAGTPIAVLTDFEEFHIIDCRYKPNIDSFQQHKLEIFHYSDYTNPEIFARIFYLFGRDAVANGSIEKYATDLPAKRGGPTQGALFNLGYKSVDETFLGQLDGYRNILARAFNKANPGLDGEALTEAVQRTLDRLVFIRFLEDKSIEDSEIIKLYDRPSTWHAFIGLCKRLEPKYNGLIFKQHPILENDGFNPPDDQTFADMCAELSDPTSPYDFDKIPISILGSIYERFLGKVVYVTSKGVTVKERHDNRKAEGVFYTPEYIVRHIVKETVGKIIAGKSPDEIAKLTFADIACGSGSFLIEIYGQLLEYHERYYIEYPDKVKKGDTTIHNGRPTLSLKKRKDILLNNIYGVDIDFQAIEVTQLSLYLKLLEDVTLTDAYQFVMLKEKILPDLRGNIVCGNSLIEHDLVEDVLFGESPRERINPINLIEVFDKPKRRGGFDAIVGNPPYVRPHNIPPIIKKLLWKAYSSFVAKSDMYSCFMERGLSLTREGGKFSYIVPKTWTSLESFTGIRSFIIENSKVQKLVQLPKKVFSQATVETCIFVLEKDTTTKRKGKNTVAIEKMDQDGSLSLIREFSQKEIEDAYLFNFQLYTKADSKSLFAKINGQSVPLGNRIFFAYGFKTADDEKFIFSTKKNSECEPFIRSGDIRRYECDQPNEFVWYVPEKMKRNAKTARPGERARFESEKIIVSRMGKKIIATYDKGGLFVKDAMLLLPLPDGYSLKFLLGILNSKLITYYYEQYFITIDVLKNALLNLPIKEVDFGQLSQKNLYEEVIRNVDSLLHAKEILKTAATEAEINRIQLFCQTIDNRIDNLVYSIYGLSPEEISMVEDIED